MKRWVLAVLLLASSAWAQSTSVTGQVTDAGGQSWNNGTYTFSFAGPPNVIWTGGAFNPQSPITGSLSSSGAISAVSIPGNDQISPGGTQWNLNVCSATIPKVCFSRAFTISGSSQSLTLTPAAIVIAVPTAPTPGAAVTAYADAEISGGWIGFHYFNTVSNTLRSCNSISNNNCNGFVGGGGSGSVTSVASGTGLTGGPITSSGTLSLSPFNTNGFANASAGINFLNSSTNAVGLTATFSNPSTNGEQLEIAGTYSGSGASIGTSTIPNAALANSSITLNGTANQLTSPGATALGGTGTFALANPLTTPGPTTVTGTLAGTGSAVFAGPRPFSDITSATYGADPTGASDITTAFNAILSANQCNILFPPGTYKLATSQISISTTCTSLVLYAFPGTVTLNINFNSSSGLPGNAGALTINQSKVTLDGFNINCDSTGSFTGVCVGASTNGASTITDLTFRNLRITDCDLACLSINSGSSYTTNGPQRVIISKSYMQCGSSANCKGVINLQGDVHSVDIEGNVLDGSLTNYVNGPATIQSESQGVLGTISITDLKIRGNTLLCAGNGTTNAGGWCAQVGGFNAGSTTGLLIADNICDIVISGSIGHTDGCFSVAATQGAAFSGNTMNCLGNSIYYTVMEFIYDSGTQANGNTINCDNAGTGAAITLNMSNNSVISGNKIAGFGSAGDGSNVAGGIVVESTHNAQSVSSLAQSSNVVTVSTGVALISFWQPGASICIGGATAAGTTGFNICGQILNGSYSRSSGTFTMFNPTSGLTNCTGAACSTSSTTTTGTNNSGQNSLTITSGTGFSNGQYIIVVGGGAAGGNYFDKITAGGGTTTLTLNSNLGTTVNAGTSVYGATYIYAENNNNIIANNQINMPCGGPSGTNSLTNNRYGIMIRATGTLEIASNNHIANNTIVGCGTGATGDQGIRFTGSATEDSNLSDGNVLFNLPTGFNISNGTNHYLRNNSYQNVTTPYTLSGTFTFSASDQAVTFAQLATCSSPQQGPAQLSNSNTGVVGAIAAAGGANNVKVFCDGTNWRVMGGNSIGTLAESSLTGSTATTTITETAAGKPIIRAGVETVNLAAAQVMENSNSTNNNTSVGLLVGAEGTSTGGIAELVYDISGTGDIARWYSGGSRAGGTYTVGTLEANLTTAGQMKPTSFGTQSNCAAAGTAANPSVAACGASVAGSFSCATNASGGTCVVNTSAVTANSEIFITQRSDGTTGTRLSVTCNTTLTTVIPEITAVTAGTSFTINLGTITTNPECFSYFIVN